MSVLDDRRLVVIDVETTGYDPTLGHTILEVACVPVVNGARAEGWSSMVGPRRPISTLAPFVGLTASLAPEQRTRVALHAIGYSAGNPKSLDGSKNFGRITAGVFRFKPDGSALEHRQAAAGGRAVVFSQPGLRSKVSGAREPRCSTVLREPGWSRDDVQARLLLR